MVEYQGQLRLHDFKCDWELKKRKAKGFCNSIMVLDIEVTSAWLKNGEVVGFLFVSSWAHTQSLSFRQMICPLM